MLDAHMRLAHIKGMRLDKYLTEAGLSEADFGRQIGLSQSAINRLRRGESWPPADTAEKIRAATGGKVTADDFLAPVADSVPADPQQAVG